ncbi:MAG: tyrosine-type recombinase/integrase [Solidesulfovibrio sp. DCME]|uniref:tyrosine-type recombinase/integrase n=1 Tax=Solidesulfovibrio sp. DCME TaxID=3447380 RepID=UPI003D123298
MGWEWHDKFKASLTECSAAEILHRLERDVFPWIGSRPVREVTAPELLAVVRRIESRGAPETARRCLQYLSRIGRYAVATGRAERDAAADLRGCLPPANKRHFSSLTDPKDIAGLLRSIDAYQGSLVVLCALRLASMTFVRPGELRKAEWTEFNLEGAEWRIPAERMKMKEQHIVPLSRQALAVLGELHPLTGSGKYVFPSVRSSARPMSENTINGALRRMGYTKEEMTGHGFRSMASTLLNEMGWNRDAIERQLAHGERNAIRASYNFAEYLPERRRMMAAWSDFLDKLRAGAKVTPIHATAVE